MGTQGGLRRWNLNLPCAQFYQTTKFTVLQKPLDRYVRKSPPRAWEDSPYPPLPAPHSAPSNTPSLSGTSPGRWMSRMHLTSFRTCFFSLPLSTILQTKDQGFLFCSLLQVKLQSILSNLLLDKEEVKNIQNILFLNKDCLLRLSLAEKNLILDVRS